jgi:pimeloyl-ACP methyl ester carboxylesterase
MLFEKLRDAQFAARARAVAPAVDGKLGAIKAPTLIVWGREDRLTPLPIAKVLSEDISGSKTAILDDCGHVPQIECAAPFNKALLDFLGGTP